MTNPADTRHRTGFLSLLLGASISLGGCHLAVDPYHDDLANQPAPTTASVEGVLSATGSPSALNRKYEQASTATADGSVIHGPLLYEDPFVVAGSEDGQYAWTGEDYFYWLYGNGHYLACTGLAPISLINTPVWQPYVSDGRPSTLLLGRPLDSKAADSDTSAP